MGVHSNNLTGEVSPIDLQQNTGMAEVFKEVGGPDLAIIDYGRELGCKGYELVGLQQYLQSGGADDGVAQMELPANAGMVEAFQDSDAQHGAPDLRVVEMGRKLGLKGLELLGLQIYVETGGAQPEVV